MECKLPRCGDERLPGGLVIYSHLNAWISDIACPFWGQFAPSGQSGFTPPIVARRPLQRFLTLRTARHDCLRSGRQQVPHHRRPDLRLGRRVQGQVGQTASAAMHPIFFPALGIGQRSHVRQYVPGFGINPPQFARIMVGIRRLYDRSFETSSRNQFRDILRVVQYPNPRFLLLSVLFGKTFVANGASCYQCRNVMFTK